jgi:hypothetical protein
MLIPNIKKIERSFIKEDKRIAKEVKKNNKEGHDFVICTNIARWLKNTMFPDAKIMGYAEWDNPTAKTNRYAEGHDFLVVNDRFIIDFWLKHTECIKDAPVMIDMVAQPDLVAEWYGDKKKWEHLEL